MRLRRRPTERRRSSSRERVRRTVVGSTDPDRAIQDFEKHRPHVLILAFNG